MMMIFLQLNAQGLLSREQSELLLKVKREDGYMETESTQSQTVKCVGSISDCIERMKQQDLDSHLSWVQDELLELCFIKLGK